ncbi:hypothetical protein [Halorussus halophilus]|uniref:hypothetical protein n=1 Tax=Halorussus halophilus TaxID=2650975 RepID=UPI00130164D4|nr:hypothetical protein [Halorussus halophilus]
MTDSVSLVALVLSLVVVGSAAFGVGIGSITSNETENGAGANTTTQTTTPENSTVSVVNTTFANVTFACDFVRVFVPGDHQYALVVHYVDSVSGQRSRASLGPLVGTVTEPYDDEIVFVEVQVLLGSSVVASAVIPDGCPGAKWA